MLQHAKAYQKKGFSVIPIRPLSKEPNLLKTWKQFQVNPASEAQIEQWWKKWPKANIGLVTGMVSDLSCIDIDQKSAFSKVRGMIPEKEKIPCEKTPRGGLHLFFKGNGFGCATGFIEGVDFKGEGGVIVVSPSVTSKGNYSPLEGKSLFDLDPPELPEKISGALSLLNKERAQQKKKDEKTEIFDGAKILEGKRDAEIFHYANLLYRRGVPIDEIEKTVMRLGLYGCDPPMKKQDIAIKIRSACQRNEPLKHDYATIVRNVTSVTKGWFFVTELYRDVTDVTSVTDVTVVTGVTRKAGLQVAVRNELSRLVKKNVLEKDPNRNGRYRRIETDIEFEDFSEGGKGIPANIILPLGLNEMVTVFPGELIVFAGTSGAGKSALAFETAYLNRDGPMEVFYFTTEISKEALKRRISKHKVLADISRWTWKVSCNVPKEHYDYIRPDGINIIDYVEPPSGDFAKLAYELTRIHGKLGDGIAVVMLQKKPKKKIPGQKGPAEEQSEAYGGWLTRAKPSVYVTIDLGGKVKVIKAKEWGSMGVNPLGYTKDIGIVNGINLIDKDPWMPDV
jgi:hypothetical protein